MRFPEQAPHFFTGVALNAIPEIEYSMLVETSQLAKANNQVQAYSDIQFAIQKLQWVKMACLRAKQIDSDLEGIEVDDSLLFDPIGQAEHSRAVFEIVAYGKAVLDSISHFLNGRWKLGMKEQSSDFKWQIFRDEVSKISPVLQEFLDSNKPWLDKGSKYSGSLPAARDEWIHRGAPEIPLAWPPTEVGALPVPKSLEASIGYTSIEANSKNFYSTKAFIEVHWGNLVRLTRIVLQEAIKKERTTQPDTKIVNAEGSQINLFPNLITVKKRFTGMKSGPYTAQG
jgi:hypothetical protein